MLELRKFVKISPLVRDRPQCAQCERLLCMKVVSSDQGQEAALCRSVSSPGGVCWNLTVFLLLLRPSVRGPVTSGLPARSSKLSMTDESDFLLTNNFVDIEVSDGK